MASIHSLTTAPINVYSKTYWTSFIAAVNEEASYELGLHEKINPEAIRQTTRDGWSASLFTPNILRHTDVYVDQSTNIDLSSRTIHEHHHMKPLLLQDRSQQKNKKLEGSKKKRTAFRNIKGWDPLSVPSELFFQRIPGAVIKDAKRPMTILIRFNNS